MSNEQRERWNKTRRERYAADPEYRKKHKIATEKWYQKKCAADPEYREKHLAYMREYGKKYRQKKNLTLFKQITASPEVLAEKLVYIWVSSWEDEFYCSTVCDGLFETKAEAISATVAKLKEGCND